MRPETRLNRPAGEDASRRRPFVRWLHDAVAVLVPIGFVVFLWTRREHLSSVLELSAFHVSMLAVLIAATWLVVAVQNLLLYRANGVAAGLGECLVLTAGSAFGDYLPMRVGTLVRARYLKVVHGLAYARFGGIFGVRTILTAAAAGLLGLAGTGVCAMKGRWSPGLLLTFGFLVGIATIAWLMPLPARAEGRGRLRRILDDLAEGARILRRRPAVSLVILLLILMQQGALAMRFYVAAVVTGEHPDPGVLLLLAPLALLISYLAVVPGGLGVREAVMGYATFATGASFTSGVYVGTVDRAVLLAMVAVFGAASFVTIWKRSQPRP